MSKPTLPEPEAPAAVTVLEATSATPLILLCDHARNAVPPGYGTLGLPEYELARHIAYDIGAEGVTRALAAHLGAPAVISHYSRLLIDLNRGLDDPTLVMRISDGAIIPGNRHLDDTERALRIETYYKPYHDAISTLIDARVTAGIAPLLLSLHSFTPVFKGHARPWHASVLWGNDPRLARPLLENLSAEQGLVIGDNEPYQGVLEGDTLHRHGYSRGLAHALLEIRQDLIASPATQSAWADRLSLHMQTILAKYLVD